MRSEELEPRAQPVPEFCCDGPGAILVGVDGSTSSFRAAAYAAGLARRQHCKLIVAYVKSTPSTMLALPEAAATVIQAQDSVEQELRTALDDVLPRLDVSIRLVVRAGDPYNELIAIARQVHAEAVIVGRSAKTFHRIAGSLAVRLVRCGHWPVTVVP